MLERMKDAWKNATEKRVSLKLGDRVVLYGSDITVLRGGSEEEHNNGMTVANEREDVTVTLTRPMPIGSWQLDSDGWSLLAGGGDQVLGDLLRSRGMKSIIVNGCKFSIR